MAPVRSNTLSRTAIVPPSGVKFLPGMNSWLEMAMPLPSALVSTTALRLTVVSTPP